jgi:hypothetical protein
MLPSTPLRPKGSMHDHSPAAEWIGPDGTDGLTLTVTAEPA